MMRTSTCPELSACGEHSLSRRPGVLRFAPAGYAGGKIATEGCGTLLTLWNTPPA